MGTGVFCESAIASAQNDNDVLMQQMQAQKKIYQMRLDNLFHMLDADDNGFISLNELTASVEDDKLSAAFESLDLDITDAMSFFKLLDSDKGGRIDVNELLRGCVKLRGNAKGTDMHRLI